LPYIVSEWANVVLRWTHVFAGIMWIGQTYFFTWLDHRLHEEKDVWMVHSGGFYLVNKHGLTEMRSQTLHWFKWEAAITWLTGLLLFGLVYYHGGLISRPQILMSLGLIVAAWFVYDLIWMSPIARNEMVGVALCYILLVGAIYGATRFFDGRAAYMQIGAMLGTIMAWNVWVRILPNQRKLIAAASSGQPVETRLADIAKQRSKQNTFIIVPVVFIMISNHFPVATYGNQYNWVVLSALVLIGWAVARVIRSR
jgi:uncharacterized membrane protein